jgi:hypothetical protein
MAGARFYGLAPLPIEWFVMWWDQTRRGAARAAEPRPWPVPEDLAWKMDEVKEQMLIRRDVLKDEQPPKDGTFLRSQSGPSIKSHEPPAAGELIPKKEWVETFEMPPREDEATRAIAPRTSPAHEAYLEWRTLIRALDDD